jgi:DNA-binding transcriptional LysR family regulator
VDLRHLAYFLSIVDEGSINAASRSLMVAQPSLSRQLRSLEKDLGLTLFDRSGAKLSLTAAGTAFLPIAKDLVTRAAQAKSSARAMAGGSVQRLTIAAASATIADIIAPFIVSQGPDGVLTNVVEATPEFVYHALQEGKADFALGTKPPPSELESVVVGRAFLWAQCNAKHPLAGREKISLQELVQWPLITMTADFGVRTMFDDAVSTERLTYTTGFEVRSAVVGQALAAAGKGICVLSDDPSFGVHAMPITHRGKDLVFTLFGVWNPLHFAAPAIRECLQNLSLFTSELYPTARM